MSYMFNYSTSFNQPLDFDTSKVTNMRYMFYYCTSFNQNIGDWDLTKVTDTSNMLNGTLFSISNMDKIVFGWSNSQPLNKNIDFVGNRTTYSLDYVQNTLGYSETEANTLTYGVSNKSIVLLYNIENNNTEITLPIIHAENMDVHDNSYNGTPLGVDNNKITLNAGYHNIYIHDNSDQANIEWQRPSDTISLESLIDIKDTRALTLPQNNTTIGYFQNCVNLIWTATDGINLTNTTNLSKCFYNCKSFNGNISNWDVSNIVNMNSMFYDCVLFDQNISNWDISKVDNFENFCYGVTISEENYDDILLNWQEKVKKINRTRIIHFGNSISSINDTIKQEYLDINYLIIDGGDQIIEYVMYDTFLNKKNFIIKIINSIEDFDGRQAKLLIDYIEPMYIVPEIDKTISIFINN